MPIITLTTDFGYKNHFVAALKGTILKSLDVVDIVDISHDISPFNIQECAYVLKNSYNHFPKGSIHIVGLDSEISPENEHLVVMIDGHYFISANNGVMSLIAAETEPEKVVEISLPNVEKNAFPSLGVFVPVACHLARGGKLEVVSKPFENLKRLKDFEPRITNEGKTIVGNIIYIDGYGNVVTNIKKSLFEAYRNGRKFEIIARTNKLTTIQYSYNGIINYTLEKNQRKGPGDALALFNTSGYIELAIFKSDLKTVGGASTLLGLGYRDVITINFL
ncbi:S-adenosyl-l-methionine hydroxide adenosyltransferase family protein [Allomuricauda sp. SCSIO 65647]|uniref:SAM hydrolase/SAM-dependent halogenase family protein n=1 Tax=Allomuricauda sp. SCSIO 65647 TaxID=2908843 RepID=UPI001F1BAF46|nr:SAM-dependent chlorinase/fluorinase [Muricauda sp. SCSIO 65647]UJH67064.1 SAM-dependent chlorinase/fluorinase [Muricauda sp. SCSIO 65647]